MIYKYPAIIINPNAQKVRRYYHDIISEIKAIFNPTTVYPTAQSGDATSITQSLLRQKSPHDLIISVGGDGTLNEIVNGVILSRHTLPIAPIPAGTSNDFLKSVTSHKHPLLEHIARLRFTQIQRCTIIQVRYTDAQTALPASRYLINVGGTGMSAEVVAKVTDTYKRFGAKSAFALGILTTLMTYSNHSLLYALDDSQYPRSGIFRSIVIANGRFNGGGIPISPLSVPMDNYFEVVIFKDLDRWQVIRSLHRLYTGDHIHDSRYCTFHRTTSLAIMPTPGSFQSGKVEIDGEFVGYLPLKATIAQKKIDIAVPAVY